MSTFAEYTKKKKKKDVDVSELAKKHSSFRGYTEEVLGVELAPIGSPVKTTVDIAPVKPTVNVASTKPADKITSLMSVYGNKDFATKSGYVSTKSEGIWEKLGSKYGMNYNDLQYEYINNQNDIRKEIDSKAVSWGSDTGKTSSSYKEKALDYMTDDEVAVYNYYYQTEGKDKAQEFLDALAETLNARKAGKDFESIEGKTAREILYGTVAGAEQFKQGVKGFGSMITGKDDYIPQTSTQILTGKIREDLADDGTKVFGNSLGQVVHDALSTGTNMLPSVMTGGVAGTILMGATAAGNAYQQDLNEFGDKEKARIYATTIGALEGTLQHFMGGIGQLGGTSAAISNAVSGVKNGALRFALEYGGKIGSEALEEGLQEVLDPVVKNWTHGTEESIDWENVAYSALLGGLMGGVFGAGEVSSTHLNANENAVVDKVYNDTIAEREADGKKLSQKEKSKIYEETLTKLEKGYIDIDTIESVLGGDTYNSYKAEVDKEAMQEADYKRQLEALKDQANTLGNAQKYQEIETKLNELKSNSKTTEIKKQLSEEVTKIVQGTKLSESYNERARRGQNLEVDVESYKSDSAKQTAQNFKDFGVNNTNASHDYLDLVTKVAEDRGHTFKFMTTKQLEESIANGNPYNIDADPNKVEAFVSGSTKEIIINMDANKSLTSLVGHEVMHTLEKANSYSDAQNALFEYAKTKGEYEDRWASIQRRYSNLTEEQQMQELTSDLVGDYVFGDTDFIRNLSTEKPNIFKKIYNEIKYLWKMATAGSKEARELERVKREFEKIWAEAYNADLESGNISEAEEVSDSEVKFSIREEAPPKETGIAYKVFYVKDGKLYPPMVANPDGADTPMGVWLNADVGKEAAPSKTGRQQVKAGGKGTQGGSGSLAFRPGWHLGDLPRASQFDRTNPETGVKELFPKDFVWAEVEYAKDMDYQEEAMSYGYSENGKFRHAYAGLPRLPENGYYRYRTNPKPDTVPWIITGAMKVNRLLSDAEVNSILEQNGVQPVHRQGGDVGLDKFGFNEDGSVKYSLADSDGNQLTKEQGEYFKDSKVRDENGNLKVMYHGSEKAGFHTFDSEYSDDGRSLFFVDNNETAKSYSGTHENYSAKTLKTAEDFNRFFEEVGATEYEVVEENGKFTLYDDGDEVATTDNADDLYEEFRDWSGIGYGSANYAVYLNITNPLTIDAQDNNWDEIPIPKEHLKGINESWDNPDPYGYLDTATTRQFSEYAQENGYDGVIFKNIIDNGLYASGMERFQPSTVAIAFDSNQIKSVANTAPTENADIRYSLSEDGTEIKTDRASEVQYSLRYDAQYMDNAIANNNSKLLVDKKIMEDTKTIRAKIAARMEEIKDKGLVGLPEDIEGNTFISNSSYGGTEENTTICPRSLSAEAFVDAVSEMMGRPLTVEEQIYISQDLQGRSLTPECTYCYVATDRKAYRAFLGEYISQRDSVIEKVKNNPDADVSRNGELYQEFLNGRKDTNPMYKRFKMWVDAYKNGKPMVDANHLANMGKLMGDINSEFGAELKPQITDAMKYAQSASWAKKRVNYVAYNGHILKWKQDRINKLNSHYGLRMYSFSDFHPAFTLENMQMITDASVRGLKMLGYTKDTDFVEIFAPSGMNINISTFGFVKDGVIAENNLIGAEWERAKELREQYPNVGITFVATDDTLVNWALDQDWIDVVIPFHLVRTGKEVAKAFKYHDYTSESSDTKTSEWTKGDEKYIAPTEHNNDKATYLAALEKNHLKPRFERFVNHPNYMKLVNECRLPASECKPVQPIFNEDASMKALAKLEVNGYYQPVGGSVDRMYEIAAEVADKMQSELAPAQNRIADDSYTSKEYGNHIYSKDVALEGVAEIAPTTSIVEEMPIRSDYAPPQEYMSAEPEVAPVVEEVTPAAEDNERILGEDLTKKNADRIRTIQAEIKGHHLTKDITKKEFDEKIAQKESQYESLSRKDTKKAVDLRNQITRLETKRDSLLRGLDGKIERANKRIESIENESRFAKRNTKQNEYRELFGKLMGDTSTWKDKKMGIQYQTNTLRRNLRDIVRDASGKQDIARADAIHDELQGSVNRNEAKKNREANEVKNVFREMKINHAESTYIQMLGELRHNPDTTLTKDVVDEFYKKNKGKIDVQKVDKAIDEARKLYDSLYDRVNAALSEHGFKEMGYRKGYFPHFTDPKQNWLAKLLNWKVNNDEIPTDIAGITEFFEPQRTWQSFDKHRKTDTTDYNFLKGLDNYVNGSLDWIYHIEDIQKHRAFETEIRYRHSSEQVQKKIDEYRNNPMLSAEEVDTLIESALREAKNPLNNFVTDLHTRTNILAGKKSSKDRNMESDFNRHAYSVMTNVTNRVTANQVVGSISSAMTNFIPITQSWGQVNPTSSLVGMKKTIQSYMSDDGVIAKSDFLTNRLAQNEALYKDAWDKIGNVAGGLMEIVDNFTSQTVWRSKYYENIKNGMTEAQAIKDADQFAENVIAGRSKGNMPTIFHAKNPVTKMLTAFQLEVANQYGYIFKDMPQDIGEKAIGKLTKGYATMFVGAYAYNALFSALTGRDSALDPIGIIQDFIRDLTGDDDEEEDVAGAIGNLASNIADEIPFVGGLLGGGRIPISSALPYNASISDAYTDVVDGDWKSVLDELSKPLYYGVMPMGGGQIRKTVQGLSMFNYDKPLAPYYGKGNIDLNSRPVVEKEDGSISTVRSMSFNEDGKEVLIPTVVNGEIVSDEEAIEHYYETGEYLGKFDTVAEANEYAEQLHEEQEELYSKRKNRPVSGSYTKSGNLRFPVEDTFLNKLQAGIFGQYASKNAREYFDRGQAPLKEKQIQEYKDLDLPISEYWDYREGLKEQETLEDKFEYIADLDVSVEQKNIMINNIVDRKEKVDMSNYDDFANYEEFDWYTKNTEKYNFLEANGVSYSEYKADEETKKEYDNIYSWYKNNPDKVTLSKAVTSNVIEYRRYASDLDDIRADKDSSGKTISGSSKKKKTEYINSLDLDYGQRIILYRSLFDSNADKAAYNADIVEYLNSRDDITYEEMVTILESLDMKVLSDGTVAW